MDSLLTNFLLLLAALMAALSYALIPSIPIATLTTAAAVLLAVGLWWHWTQFAVDYRTSTWQEQLRHYGSFVLVFLVILLSYGVYAFSKSGVSITDITNASQSFVRNSMPRSNTNRNSTGGGVNILGNLGFGGGAEEEEEKPANTSNVNQQNRGNFLI